MAGFLIVAWIFWREGRVYQNTHPIGQNLMEGLYIVMML